MGEGRDNSELSAAEVEALIVLPPARITGGRSVSEAIQRRRSIRRFAPDPVSLEAISQLLWSAQGVTARDGRRAAPSAGASYPLELYLACAEGLFRYVPERHAVVKVRAEDVRAALVQEGRADAFVARAPVVLLFAAVYERTTRRYGDQGIRYVHLDVGHAAENVHLQAEALGLASVPVGAFSDSGVSRAGQLPADHKPVSIIPIGRPA